MIRSSQDTPLSHHHLFCLISRPHCLTDPKFAGCIKENNHHHPSAADNYLLPEGHILKTASRLTMSYSVFCLVVGRSFVTNKTDYGYLPLAAVWRGPSCRQLSTDATLIIESLLNKRNRVGCTLCLSARGARRLVTTYWLLCPSQLQPFSLKWLLANRITCFCNDRQFLRWASHGGKIRGYKMQRRVSCRWLIMFCIISF